MSGHLSVAGAPPPAALAGGAAVTGVSPFPAHADHKHDTSALALTGHTHVEADITDLSHYTTSDFNTDFATKVLGDLSDVVVTAVADDEVLAWDTGTSKWINQTPAEAGLADTSHAATHVSGGSDEIDGDVLDIDWNPTNYTPATTPAEVTSVDELTAHLYGIDQALTGMTEATYSPTLEAVTTDPNMGTTPVEKGIKLIDGGFVTLQGYHAWDSAGSPDGGSGIWYINPATDSLPTLDDTAYEDGGAAVPFCVGICSFTDWLPSQPAYDTAAGVSFQGPGSYNNVVIDISGASQAGNVMVTLVIANINNGVTPSTPSGWTQDVTGANAYGRFTTFTRIFTGATSNPTITWSSAQTYYGYGWWSYTNVDSYSENAAWMYQQNANPPSHTAAANVESGNDLWVCGHGVRETGGNEINLVPSGYTQRWDADATLGFSDLFYNLCDKDGTDSQTENPGATSSASYWVDAGHAHTYAVYGVSNVARRRHGLVYVHDLSGTPVMIFHLDEDTLAFDEMDQDDYAESGVLAYQVTYYSSD